MLLVSSNGTRLIEALNPEAYNILVVEDPGRAMEMLRDSEYDLVVLDETVFGSDVVGVVREIRRRFPLTPVLIMSENKDTAFQTDLMEAGATDFLSDDLYHKEELQRRLRLVLQQRRQNRALARRNSHLQALTSLARRLHTSTDPQTLIAETIDLACKTFNLYGMAIVMSEGELLEIYAGSAGTTPETLQISTIRPHLYDPLRRVINSGFVQTFANIQADSYYTPIAALPRVESAIIIPLAYPEYTYGALAVFGAPNQMLNQDDLIIYELFAAQFTTALQNAQLYEEQERRVQASSHLLRAWQRFITLNTVQDIASSLRELVEDINSVSSCVVWLYTDELGKDIIVSARQPEVVDTFYTLYKAGLADQLYDDLDDRLQVTLRLGRGQNNPLGPLFRALRGQELMLFPVTDSARLAGGVIASAAGNKPFGIEDANLMKSLAHAAGQALVRNLLTNAMSEKGGRLEAILRSIYEGIVFVDHTGYVAFCNPQFTELTNISPLDVLNHSADVLLRRLSEEARDAAGILSQLEDTVQAVWSGAEPDENYGILEVSLTNNREILIEFSRIISTLNNEYLGWIGIIRDNSRLKSMFTTQMSMLDLMSEQIRVPHAELRGLVTTLQENHTRFSNRERTHFLRQIEHSIENMGELWENFLDMYHLEIAGLVLEREESDLYDIVQQALDNRLFAEVRRQFRVEAPARLPMVKVDEVRMERVITNILVHALSYSPKGAPIIIRLEDYQTEVHVVVIDQSAGLPPERLNSLFAPFNRVEDTEPVDAIRLSLYISYELVQRHGGRIWADSAPGKGTTITVALPTIQSGAAVLPPTRSEAAPLVEPPAYPAAPALRAENRQVGYSVQKRQPKTIMFVEGSSSLVQFLRSKLEEQGYEILLYRSGEDALSDVKAIRLDMIVLDVNLADANSLDVCERMRKRTEVPIVMMADEASEAEEVRALKNFGADAFITRPISEEQLMARVDVILKRVMDIPVRTREPLDLGDLYIDFARREVFFCNKPIELTRIEYDLLHTLAVNENQVLTHKQLLEKVWGPEYQAETQYLWVNVSRLRKKLEPTADSPRYIHTQQGVGYVFRRP
jgi:DNA-binding response OmpR family regulator/signal transduction histidine kinase